MAVNTHFPVKYRIPLQFSAWNPATGVVNSYFSTFITVPPTSAAIRKTYFRRSGIITAAEVNTFATGGAGSAEAFSVYIKINNGAEYLVATVSASTQERIFLNQSLNIPVFVNDYFEIKMTTGFTTSPTNVIGCGFLEII